MNLKQLIASTHKVVSARWNTSRTFESKPFGAILSIDLKGLYNPKTRTLRFDMSITAKSQGFDTIRFYDNEDAYKGKHPMETPFVAENRQKIHTHTCSIMFLNIDQVVLDRKAVKEKLWENNPKRLDQWGIMGEFKEKQAERLAIDDAISEIKEKYNVEKAYRDGDRTIYRTPISLNSPVKVRCTCGNFYYAFAWYNADNNCLIGNRPPEYEKFVESEEALPFKLASEAGVTVMNENRVPGLCKHLQLLIAILLDNNLISSKYCERFNETINPGDFAEKKLKFYEKLSEKIAKEAKKVAKEEQSKFLSDLRRKGNEIKLHFYYKKKKR